MCVALRAVTTMQRTSTSTSTAAWMIRLSSVRYLKSSLCSTVRSFQVFVLLLLLQASITKYATALARGLYGLATGQSTAAGAIAAVPTNLQVCNCAMKTICCLVTIRCCDCATCLSDHVYAQTRVAFDKVADHVDAG